MRISNCYFYYFKSCTQYQVENKRNARLWAKLTHLLPDQICLSQMTDHHNYGFLVCLPKGKTEKMNYLTSKDLLYCILNHLALIVTMCRFFLKKIKTCGDPFI